MPKMAKWSWDNNSFIFHPTTRSAVNNKNNEDQKERAADIPIHLFDGHDTTCYSIARILLEFPKNSEEQEKVQQELLENINEQHYAWNMLRNVFHEGIKLYLEEGRELAPKTFHWNLVILWSQRFINSVQHTMIQYNGDHFEDLEEFKPSRWENPSKATPQIYVLAWVKVNVQ